jgi:hypothetical protein
VTDLYLFIIKYDQTNCSSTNRINSICPCAIGSARDHQSLQFQAPEQRQRVIQRPALERPPPHRPR